MYKKFSEKKHAKHYELLRLLKLKESKSKRKILFYTEFKLQEYLLLEERVHSETKIMNKIKLDPNIVPFAFFLSIFRP